MADVFTKKQRSEVMRQVKSSRNKSTELKLIDFFKTNNIKGWRRSYKLFGKPDFTFPKIKVVIFVDGCFWHGHDCRNTRPKDNADYWTKKRERNVKRDKEVTQTLESKGWTVIRLWECELKDKHLLSEKLQHLTQAAVFLPLRNLLPDKLQDELNFPSQSFFGKYFKRIVGVSPKEYKRK